jgi:phage-related protein
VNDATSTWRIIYRLDADAVVIADVFSKKTQATPKAVIDCAQRRLSQYDRDADALDGSDGGA